MIWPSDLVFDPKCPSFKPDIEIHQEIHSEQDL